MLVLSFHASDMAEQENMVIFSALRFPARAAFGGNSSLCGNRCDHGGNCPYRGIVRKSATFELTVFNLCNRIEQK